MFNAKILGFVMIASLTSCADKSKPADDAASVSATTTASTPEVPVSASAVPVQSASAVVSSAAAAAPAASAKSVEQCSH
jgi:hypothetical protein